MKTLFLISTITLLISCQKTISQETTEQIKKNETFWKNRNIMITKNEIDREYPIKKDAVISDKRSNAIYIHSSGVQFEVLIDDVLLYNFKGEASMHQGGAMGLHEINPLMLSSGIHEVKVRIYPEYGKKVFGEGGSMLLTFQYYPYNNLKEVTYNLSANGSSGISLDQESEYWKDEEGDYRLGTYIKGHYEPKEPLKLKGLPMYEWRSNFEAEVPFDLIGWRNSINLKKENQETKSLQKELLLEYKNIYEIIKNKEIDKFLGIIKEREAIVSQTLYYGTKENKLRDEEFVKLLQNNDYEIEPIFEESLHMDFQGYGKLVTFLHKADKEGVIRLKNKKNPDEVIYLDFLFQRKLKNGKLSII